MAITIIVADDHPIVAEGILAVFKAEKDFTVVAQCANGEQTIAAVRAHKPAILLLDLDMPGMAGIDVLRKLQESQIATRVIVFTAAITENELADAMRLGARGLLLKGLPAKLIVQCIRDVYEGKFWLERDSLSNALGKLLRVDEGRRVAAGVLTQREIQIAKGVATGSRNAEIGKQLHISEGTVKMHLHNIYQKVGVDSRLRLSHWAKEKGLV